MEQFIPFENYLEQRIEEIESGGDLDLSNYSAETIAMTATGAIFGPSLFLRASNETGMISIVQGANAAEFNTGLELNGFDARITSHVVDGFAVLESLGAEGFTIVAASGENGRVRILAENTGGRVTLGVGEDGDPVNIVLLEEDSSISIESNVDSGSIAIRAPGDAGSISMSAGSSVDFSMQDENKSISLITATSDEGFIEILATGNDGAITLTASGEGGLIGLSANSVDGLVGLSAAGEGGSVTILGDDSISLVTNGDASIGLSGDGVTIGTGASELGFYGAAPVAFQTGVAVTAEAIHAALVTLGLIAA